MSTSPTYWSTGIVVYRVIIGGQPAWGAFLSFRDDMPDGVSDADAGRVSTMGTLTTRQPIRNGASVSGLSAAIDGLIGASKQMGIQFRNPTLSYVGDGVHTSFTPPDNWKELLCEEALRIGYMPYYGTRQQECAENE